MMALQKVFCDPSSPKKSVLHLPTHSISHIVSSIAPQDLTHAAKEAKEYAFEDSYDPDSIYKDKVLWAEMDSFGQVLSLVGIFDFQSFIFHIISFQTR